MSDEIVILSAVRTPLTAFLGEFKSESASDLGAQAIRGALQRASIGDDQIDEVVMGCVLQAGQGQAPARQAVIKAGLSKRTAATTINKMCGSGLQSIVYSKYLLESNQAKIVVAGGMESMSNTPYLIDKARSGLRMGHTALIDHMFIDGLEDAYEKRPMGSFAQEVADNFHITREEMDNFAIQSFIRARDAIESGVFDSELVSIEVTQKHKKITIDKDEKPYQAKLENISTLSAVFKDGGTITAANSSSIADGAAAITLSTRTYANENNLMPIARIVGQSVYAGEPSLFATAPIFAIKKLLKEIKWDIDEVDLFEVNEAFALVPLLVMKELEIPHSKMNVFGGACALGHPLGASGTRIVVTLINALKKQKLKKGIAAVCIGGGEALAISVEII